jgi:hypothetical protein
MTEKELFEEISIELEQIETVLRELNSLHDDVKGREPTVREKTAASSFLAQFYGGIENILKRIGRFNRVNLPKGDTWHVDLFKQYCSPPHKTLPLIFDEALAADMAPYRKFRHIVHHGYGFELDWLRMQEGIEKIEDVYVRFKANVLKYLDMLDNT